MVGLKLAFAMQTLKQQTSLKKKSVHLPDSDDRLDFVKIIKINFKEDVKFNEYE